MIEFSTYGPALYNADLLNYIQSSIYTSSHTCGTSSTESNTLASSNWLGVSNTTQTPFIVSNETWNATYFTQQSSSISMQTFVDSITAMSESYSTSGWSVIRSVSMRGVSRQETNINTAAGTTQASFSTSYASANSTTGTDSHPVIVISVSTSSSMTQSWTSFHQWTDYDSFSNGNVSSQTFTNTTDSSSTSTSDSGSYTYITFEARNDTTAAVSTSTSTYWDAFCCGVSTFSYEFQREIATTKAATATETYCTSQSQVSEYTCGTDTFTDTDWQTTTTFGTYTSTTTTTTTTNTSFVTGTTTITSTAALSYSRSKAVQGDYHVGTGMPPYETIHIFINESGDYFPRQVPGATYIPDEVMVMARTSMTNDGTSISTVGNESSADTLYTTRGRVELTINKSTSLWNPPQIRCPISDHKVTLTLPITAANAALSYHVGSNQNVNLTDILTLRPDTDVTSQTCTTVSTSIYTALASYSQAMVTLPALPFMSLVNTDNLKTFVAVFQTTAYYSVATFDPISKQLGYSSGTSATSTATSDTITTANYTLTAYEDGAAKGYKTVTRVAVVNTTYQCILASYFVVPILDGFNLTVWASSTTTQTGPSTTDTTTTNTCTFRELLDLMTRWAYEIDVTTGTRTGSGLTTCSYTYVDYVLTNIYTAACTTSSTSAYVSTTNFTSTSSIAALSLPGFTFSNYTSVISNGNTTYSSSTNDSGSITYMVLTRTFHETWIQELHPVNRSIKPIDYTMISPYQARGIVPPLASSFENTRMYQWYYLSYATQITGRFTSYSDSAGTVVSSEISTTNYPSSELANHQFSMSAYSNRFVEFNRTLTTSTIVVDTDFGISQFSHTTVQSTVGRTLGQAWLWGAQVFSFQGPSTTESLWTTHSTLGTTEFTTTQTTLYGTYVHSLEEQTVMTYTTTEAEKCLDTDGNITTTSVTAYWTTSSQTTFYDETSSTVTTVYGDSTYSTITYRSFTSFSLYDLNTANTSTGMAVIHMASTVNSTVGTKTFVTTILYRATLSLSNESTYNAQTQRTGTIHRWTHTYSRTDEGPHAVIMQSFVDLSLSNDRYFIAFRSSTVNNTLVLVNETQYTSTLFTSYLTIGGGHPMVVTGEFSGTLGYEAVLRTYTTATSTVIGGVTYTSTWSTSIYSNTLYSSSFASKGFADGTMSMFRVWVEHDSVDNAGSRMTAFDLFNSRMNILSYGTNETYDPQTTYPELTLPPTITVVTGGCDPEPWC